MRTLSNDNIDNLRLFVILSSILGLNICNELIIDFVLHEVDGASTKSTAHDAASGNAILFCNVIQIVKLLA